jgi:diguanylate cyclase (GGDEF)-like protein
MSAPASVPAPPRRDLRGLPASPLRSADLLRRTLVAGYLVAASTCTLVSLVTPGSDHGNKGLLGLACVEFLIALVLVLGRELPGSVIRFFGFSGAILLTSLAVVFARPLGPTPLYYLWPALNCGYFGCRRDRHVVSVVMFVSFALAMLFATDAQVPVITFMSVVSIFIVVLVAVQLQVERTDELVHELAHAAATDGLTGLLDRRAFNHAFTREVERARASELALSLVYFDLDHFKELNDGFGHSAGDEALCAFARILEAECSVADLVARMGGEEFAVVLFGADSAIAGNFAERIANSLAEWAELHPPLVTTSVGIATLSPETATPADMLTAADRALYAAKAAGRNRVLAAGQDDARVLVFAA